MCVAAGIEEKKTNHSLRATGATAMFSANVPEKVIRDITGHQSNALHLYERPTVLQKQELSKVLVEGKENFDISNVSREASVYKAPTNPAANSVQQCPSNTLGSIFSGLNNCNITISPQNFIVQVGPSQAQSNRDFSYLFSGVNMEEFEQC